ncbi:DsbE family thiol:disulfide interchange protein [Limnobacter sp.]|uniref:DsbE family thiol:disulfide interchange protein n=1 Tax=Limnobacter sp. TaxID=2003368 RepID=UPI0025839AD2|nr:DsbE family thiol:disulfide interchange protein [Limnobacter sp.]
MPKRLKLFLPLLVLAFLGVFLFRGLWLDPKKLPSALIGKPVATMNLPVLPFDPSIVSVDQIRDFRTNKDFLGKPWLLNVFASWCQSCLEEHPRLLKLAKEKKVFLVGLAYKDDLEATRQWLAEHGNPYSLILVDQTGRFGIDMGVYGVPETFVINDKNIIVRKQVGPIPANFDPDRP